MIHEPRAKLKIYLVSKTIPISNPDNPHPITKSPYLPSDSHEPHTRFPRPETNRKGSHRFNHPLPCVSNMLMKRPYTIKQRHALIRMRSAGTALIRSGQPRFPVLITPDPTAIWGLGSSYQGRSYQAWVSWRWAWYYKCFGVRSWRIALGVVGNDLFMIR